MSMLFAPRHRRRTLGGLVFAAALMALVSCGGSSTGAGGTTGTGSSSSAGGTVHVTLKHVPTGEATLTYEAASKSLMVEIKLTGLAPNSMHPSHIHTGSCENQGNVIYPLNAVDADSTGAADVKTTIANVAEGIPANGWYVNVHNGPALTPAEQFEPIVCGNVSNSGGGTSVTVPLTEGPKGTDDQVANGTADLSIEGGQLKVSISAHGLTPNSLHAAHIHGGSCSSEGSVVHPLPDLKADGGGNVSTTATIPGVTTIPGSGWYVNIHRTAVIGTQTGFDPILCGDVKS